MTFQPSADQIWAHNSLLLREHLRLTQVLAEDGIDALAYKGPGLALALYGDLGARWSSDVDVLIRRRDIDKAARAMRNAGYRPKVALSPTEVAQLKRESCQLNFYRDDVLVEAHWSILPPALRIPIDTDAFFERSRAHIHDGIAIRTPSMTDLAIALLAHGTKHAWSRTRWLSDIATLWTHPEVDWDAVRAWARAAGARRLIEVPLAACASLELIEGFAAADARVGALAREVVSRLDKGREQPAWTSKYLIAVRERASDRVRVAAALLAQPTPDFRRKTRLPEPLNWVVRPPYVLYQWARRRT